jgi:hypothetical protein
MDNRRLPHDLMPRPLAIAAAWGLVTIAYTPPALLVSRGQGASVDLLQAFVGVASSFVPWALATRPLLRLCARAPLGPGGTWRNLLLLGAAGLLALPTLALAGQALSRAVAWATGLGPAGDLRQVLSAALITALFATPTYVAVIGVGQALVYLGRVRERERLLARARLDALRAQVNPHFLFNALQAIGELAHRDGARAQRAVSRLADVLRATLATDVDLVPLADEIAAAKDHIELHRLLLPGPLDFRVSAAPEAWDAAVPALLIQPLVENALVHGLSRSPDDAWLSIEAGTQGDRLRLTIANARADASARASRGFGIGLANARERLRALYGDKASLDVREEPGRFVAEVTLPLRRVEGAEA